MKTPKVFISYSWSSEVHESWVEQLAEQLMQAGIETVFDKWDLHPGNNAYHFMEKMVNDDSIDKVLIVCDEAYVKKANRLGDSGVSTETQIISPAVYSHANQSKFVALVTERDSNGKAYLPTYFSTNMYMDFSNPAQMSQNFEKLVRFIFNQPAHKKPPIGKPPTYVTAPDTPSLGTTAAFHRAYSALREGKNFAEGAVEEYFQTFIENLSRFKVTFVDIAPDKKADLTYDNIKAMLPFRNEAAELFTAIAQHAPTSTTTKSIHRFFENLTTYLFPTQNTLQTDWDQDNFKFLGRELYLYLTASFIKQERFTELNEILDNTFFVRAGSHRYQNSLCDHSIFSWQLASLQHKNKEQKLERSSLTATLLKERAGVARTTFTDIMQADFILYLRAKINIQDGLHSPSTTWWPDTAVYIGHHAEPFELFLKASSKRYYERTKPIFANWNIEKIIEFVNEMVIDKQVPRFGWSDLPIKELIGADSICRRP